MHKSLLKNISNLFSKFLEFISGFKFFVFKNNSNNLNNTDSSNLNNINTDIKSLFFKYSEELDEIYFDEIIQISEYSWNSRKKILSIKLYHNKNEIKYFNDNLKKALTTLDNIVKINKSETLITYVPINIFQYIYRWYSHVFLSAKTLSKLSGIRLISCFKKSLSIKKQSSLNKIERHSNLKNRFTLSRKIKNSFEYKTKSKFKTKSKTRPEIKIKSEIKINNNSSSNSNINSDKFEIINSAIYNKDIIILDDVVASGVTINILSKMLKEAWAKNVYVIVYAGTKYSRL